MRRSTLRLSAFLALTALPLARASAQATINISASVNGDSVAHIVPRTDGKHASFSITNRDGAAQLLLMDTTIVAQLTDRGIDRLGSAADSTARADTGGVFARMVSGAVMGAIKPLLDHGIAYHLRDLRSADYADGRLVIRGRDGKEVFGKMNVNKHELMESFSPADAREFARRAKAAADRLQ
jgi:hypothetical protein